MDPENPKYICKSTQACLCLRLERKLVMGQCRFLKSVFDIFFKSVQFLVIGL